jgi:hypothetical protein
MNVPKSDPQMSTALVPMQPPPLASIWDDVRLQKLWLSVERKTWRSLAVLPASPLLDAIPMAELLAQLAWRYRGQPSTVCDLRDLTMRLADHEVREMAAQVASGTRVVVALRSVFENPTSAAVAKQTDAVALCIALGETKFRHTQETIDAVGRENIIGTIVLHPKRHRRLKA